MAQESQDRTVFSDEFNQFINPKVSGASVRTTAKGYRWKIWARGETVEEVMDRVSRLDSALRERFGKPAKPAKERVADIVVWQCEHCKLVFSASRGRRQSRENALRQSVLKHLAKCQPGLGPRDASLEADDYLEDFRQREKGSGTAQGPPG